MGDEFSDRYTHKISSVYIFCSSRVIDSTRNMNDIGSDLMSDELHMLHIHRKKMNQISPVWIKQELLSRQETHGPYE